MEFIEFDSLLEGIRDGSISPGHSFTHYSDEDEWEFGGEWVLGYAEPTPDPGGWWGEPYQGNYVYLFEDGYVFLDHASEGDGDDYARYLGTADSQESLIELLALLIIDENVEMHFAFERNYKPAQVPKEHFNLMEVAVDSAWMRIELPEAEIGQLTERLDDLSPVYRAFRALLAEPAAREWDDFLVHAEKHHDFSPVYEKFKP